MLSTISFISMLLIGCGESSQKTDQPAKPEEPAKTEAQIKEEVKKEIEEEAKAKEEEAKAKEEEKAALKEEIKEELKAEEKAKPTPKAAPKEKEFSARVSVDKVPVQGRKIRFEKAAKTMLLEMAKKAGYPKMVGSISFDGDKPNCPGSKCVWKAKAKFSK